MPVVMSAAEAQQSLFIAGNSSSSISPHNSSTPLISSAQRHDLQNAGNPRESETVSAGIEEKDSKAAASKRRLFGLGGKKKEETQTPLAPTMDSTTDTTQQAPVLPSSSPLKQQPEVKASAQPIPVSPPRNPLRAAIAASASPSRLRSSSPRLHSPASSEIFERNVQEPIPISNLGNELSPAHIPTHVITEDSIPPALEASAQAITSEELNPDDVEIVMSASHQPAAVTVLEGSASHADLTQLGSPTLGHQRSTEESEPASSLHQSGVIPGAAEDDGASTYGQLDPNDVRRLSFISFKDIVQTEQMAASSSAGDRDSIYGGNLPASLLHLENHRAASPLRSPRSPASTHSHSLSGGLATPPLNVDAVAEQSPVRSITTNATTGTGGGLGQQHGELTIETMRQALRKTASGDLGSTSGRRAEGISSPVSGDEGSLREAPRSRTNT